MLGLGELEATGAVLFISVHVTVDLVALFIQHVCDDGDELKQKIAERGERRKGEICVGG